MNKASTEAELDNTEALQELGTLGYIDYSPEIADKGQLGVVSIDRRRSHPGYNLYTYESLPTAFLIDETGTVVRSWKHDLRQAYCELLPNGDLLAPGTIPVEDRNTDADSKGRLLRMSWDGEIVWRRDVWSHHDVEVTPRDQILTLTVDYSRGPIHPQGLIRDTPLTLLTQDGEVINKLPLYEVFSARPDLFELKTAGLKVRNGPQKRIDLFHTNSIEWMRHKHLESRDAIYSAGNVLISMRHQDAVAIIDWDAGELVWAWGPGEIRRPHDATMLESGNILLFDNGRGRGWSRVIELDPLTRHIVWEYQASTPTDFYTATRGSSQRLGNGNTLITNSNSGQEFEVTPKGEVVWEFLSPHLNKNGRRATIVRMKRYEREYIDRILRRYLKADAPQP